MTTYGHDLQFGSFLTPSAGTPDTVVALAQLAEQVGLDLVTFQDHPYQPAFLDTWTLLSYVAARTERISARAERAQPAAAPAGRDRPQRREPRPAQRRTARAGPRAPADSGTRSRHRAAARLTPGRRWPRSRRRSRSSGRSGTVDAPRGVRVEGEHYRVVGAKRGPAPAHDIGIWIGAYQPRMLRLTGSVGRRLAALAGLPQGRSRRARGDERRHRRRRRGCRAGARARSGGCSTSPASSARTGGGFLQVRRRSGSPSSPCSRSTYGISAFILGSDDPEALQTFGRRSRRRYASGSAQAPSPGRVVRAGRSADHGRSSGWARHHADRG